MPTQTESFAPVIYNIRPVDGAICKVNLELTTDVPDPVSDYPVGQEFTFILGESDTLCGDMIEEEIGNLSVGQTCNVKIPPDSSGTRGSDFKLTLKSFQNRQPVYKLSETQKLDIAKKHKAKGVELFKNDQIEYAFTRFSKALKFLILLLPAKDMNPGFITEVNELRVQCYSNMALCQLKFERFDFVVENCCKALDLDPRNIKCLYRRAEAYYKLGKLEECKASCDEGLKVDPHSKSLQRLQEKVEREFCDR